MVLRKNSTIIEYATLEATGAFLLRQVHGLLAWKPHKAFLFVDDLLCALVRLGGAVLLRDCCANFVEEGAVPGQPHVVWLGDQLLPRHHSARVR